VNFGVTEYKLFVIGKLIMNHQMEVKLVNRMTGLALFFMAQLNHFLPVATEYKLDNPTMYVHDFNLI
jgi:hypothetical protein